MPLETPVHVASELASRGYNADRDAVTLLANAADPEAAIERAVDAAPADEPKISADHVRTALEASRTEAREATASDSTDDGTAPNGTDGGPPSNTTGDGTPPNRRAADDVTVPHPTVSTGESADTATNVSTISPPETADASAEREAASGAGLAVVEDMTGWSTGTGQYDDFVAVFRDRYQRLSAMLRGRVNHRPVDAIERMSGGSDAALVGMVSDVRSTAGGHWLVELEDTTGVFPCLVMEDRPFADAVRELLLDEVIAVEGTLADDGGILFVDALHFPDVPRTHEPSTADRHVRAALISDIHVGSQEFLADAWSGFADWLHTDEAKSVEYLLIAGDMVEGVGVYPDQDEELDIVDVYDQYAAFNEYLKEVPGDLEIVMIPGNHDAVRLAEPQPAFDQELRDLMAAHDARFASNPGVVDLEGVSVLMYHGVSLDEVIAELPDESASYASPEEAMAQLLRKRHLAPQFGGHTRLAPEAEDHLVIEEVPDVFHAGHVHTVGFGQYHNVLTINSGCWQAQTAFQASVNLDPDPGYAPIVDLDTLELTVRKFA